MNFSALNACILLAGLLPAAGGAAEPGLPDFNLNARRAAQVYNYSEDRVPPVPPPTDTGFYARYGGAGARLNSAVTVIVADGAGRAEIVFPEAERNGAGYRSSLFVRLTEEGRTAVLSWAAVFCSGGRYIGYKGSTLELPRGGGDFLLRDEALVLGPLKARLLRTHPWLAGRPGPDSLCSPGLPARLGYTVRSLPAKACGLGFKYDRPGGRLTVTWKK